MTGWSDGQVTQPKRLHSGRTEDICEDHVSTTQLLAQSLL